MRGSAQNLHEHSAASPPTLTLPLKGGGNTGRGWRKISFSRDAVRHRHGVPLPPWRGKVGMGGATSTGLSRLSDLRQPSAIAHDAPDQRLPDLHIETEAPVP